MPNRVIFFACCLIILSAYTLRTGAQTSKVYATFGPDGESSLPPVPGLYSCVQKLHGKRLVPGEPESCLESILSYGYFQGGRIEKNVDKNGIELKFILRAAALRLTEVRFGIPDESLPNFRAFASKGGGSLSAGDTYTLLGELDTTGRLESFLESQGERAIVSRDLTLDYRAGTAKLIYHVWEASPSLLNQLPPPYTQSCDVHVREFSMVDTNEFVPIPLVQDLSKQYHSFCFSDRLVTEDEENLRRTGIFQTAKYSVQGSGNVRSLSLTLRARPITISDVQILGYGLFASRRMEDAPPLPLHIGKVYRRSDAGEANDILKAFFARQGVQFRVFENDRQTPDGKLSVSFEVLGAPNDALSINGKEIGGRVDQPLT
jgi:hypothetical protein